MTVQLPILNNRFRSAESYARPSSPAYELLPFRFIILDESRYVLSNLAGEHAIVSRDQLRQLIKHGLSPNSAIYDELKAKHFLIDGDSTVVIDLLATKYRTKQVLLSEFTSLFLFVVTLRCDHSCPYCQVSRQSSDRHAFDMSADTADRAIDFMFRTPSPNIKVEFQGGEPLLNFDLIQQLVLKVKERNRQESRQIQFVIATNSAYLTDAVLGFCKEHDIYLSTSLDGPSQLHNKNRPRPGGDSYERTIDGINRARAALGHDRVAALMTTTEASLSQPKEIIDEYIRQGFESIFLRPISPYGFAVKTGQSASYGVDHWLTFYRDGLSYILELNARGIRLVEEYSALLLRKVLTPFATGYVDLQSPAGIGISCLAFNYDGDIYASDEARMLAEMGDHKFRLGNVNRDSYEDVMLSPVLIEALEATMTEVMPMCADCGFQPYCGSDPVQHYATQGDVVGHKPTSVFCRKNMEVLRHLFRLLEDDPRAADTLKSWL